MCIKLQVNFHHLSPNLPRASESNDKVVRLESWNHSMRLAKKIAAKSTVVLSEA
jgi:hypothetical protein